MRADQPPSPSNPSTSASNPLHSLQPASTDKQPFEDNRSDERLLDPSAPSRGTTMYPSITRGDRLFDLSYHSSMPRGNGAPTYSNIPNILHTNLHYDPLSLGNSSQQFHHGNASQYSGTLEHSYFGQPQTIYPFPAPNISFDDSQQSISLPQSGLGPHPQSQELVELGLLYPPFRANTSFGPPAEAATTSFRHESIDELESQVTNLPPSAVRGIELASPRPADGETTVQVRRDTLVILSFNMQNLSSGSATYDGLKIPSTPLVNRKGSEVGKKLLSLQIRVLGATTKALYETLCHKCKDRAGDKDAFPDFRAKSNILVPQKNGRLLVAFILACCSKHREPQDSEYRLEVVLNGGPEQNVPSIQYEIPYSFSIVSKLPPRTRHEAGDVDAEDPVVPPPPKLPRTDSGRPRRVGNPASQSTEPSGPEALSSGESGGPTNSVPSGTSEDTVPFLDNRHSTSPAEPLMPSQQCRQTLNTANVEETADGRDLVIDRTNPSRGPTTGGPEIWISGSNFPTGLTSLYVRFGDNFARAVPQKPDLLSCFLPQANGPGVVTVALSRSPIPSAPVLGTSLCRFEYFTDLNEMLPVIIRIQEDCTPEVAAALDILHKEMRKRNSKRNEKRPLREEETRHSEIETAIIQALAPLQNTLDFGQLISRTNDYKQTLAHFAVLFGYPNLLRRLVGWNIDLTIADFNGSTALHCAYKKGDRVCVDLLLENGASETVLDALGRAPSHLMPEGFVSLNDQDINMRSDAPLKLERKCDALSLLQSADSGHGVSDPADEKSMFDADSDNRIKQEFDQTNVDDEYMFHADLDDRIKHEFDQTNVDEKYMLHAHLDDRIKQEFDRTNVDEKYMLHADLDDRIKQEFGQTETGCQHGSGQDALFSSYHFEKPISTPQYNQSLSSIWIPKKTLLPSDPLWPTSAGFSLAEDPFSHIPRPPLQANLATSGQTPFPGGGRNGSDININVDIARSNDQQIGPYRSGRTYTRRESKPYQRPTPSVTRKTRPVSYEVSLVRLQQRCRAQGADEGAIGLLGKVFANEISLAMLTRSLTDAEVETKELGIVTGRVYTAFLELARDGRYICRLCHRDQTWKYARDAVRHLTRDHFGLAERCGDCGRMAYTTGEMSNHRCGRCR